MKKSVMALGVAIASLSSLATQAWASPIGTLNTGSAGTVTYSLTSITFNNDPSATGGGNSEVATGTTMKFAGCPSGTLGLAGCLFATEGITVTSPIASGSVPENVFLSFSAHPSFIFSLSSIGPGAASTNCAAAVLPGQSCSIFAGSPLLLTRTASGTQLSLSVAGKVSDTGVGGLPLGSTYIGSFDDPFNQNLPNGNAPTPANMQLFFCPSGTCVALDFNLGLSITSSQSGNFFASAPSTSPVPEPATLSMLGLGLLGMGFVGRRKMRK